MCSLRIPLAERSHSHDVTGMEQIILSNVCTLGKSTESHSFSVEAHDVGLLFSSIVGSFVSQKTFHLVTSASKSSGAGRSSV